MGFLSKASSNTYRALTIDEWVRNVGGGPSWAGDVVGIEAAMRVSTIFACYRIISNDVAGLPVSDMRKVGRSWTPVDPQPRFLTRPNAEMFWPEFAGQAAGSLVSNGNLFIDIRNYPNLFLLDPREVMVGRVKAGDSTFSRAWGLADNELIYTVGGKLFTRAEILHLRGITLPGSDRGLSPLDAAMQEAGIQLATQRFTATFYRNGATVSAVLEIPKDGGGRETATELLADWTTSHDNADKAHSTAVLWGGTSYKPVSVTQQQAQFLETREWGVIDIGTRIYGVPPHRLGVISKQTSFGTGMEAQNTSLVSDAVSPIVVLLEAGLSSIIPDIQQIRFDLAGLMRADSRARAAYYTAGVKGGWMCPDEARESEGKNPIPDGLGKVFRIDQNIIPLDSAVAAPAPPPAEPDPSGQGGAQ